MGPCRLVRLQSGGRRVQLRDELLPDSVVVDLNAPDDRLVAVEPIYRPETKNPHILSEDAGSEHVMDDSSALNLWHSVNDIS